MDQAALIDLDRRVDSPEKRFHALNRDRLRRVHENLTPRQRDFIEVLPLIFHQNVAALPGFVGNNVPFGISNYTPSNAAMRAAKRISKTFELTRRSAPRNALRGLYMMGSPGTIAYSRTSDLDMWLIHEDNLDNAGITALEAKAHKVETYAANLGLEVHFFVFSAKDFRQGGSLSLSEESSGSSQHDLLLDEFYRSALLVAGLPPLWWRVPAEYDRHYEDYVAEAARRRQLDPTDYIDFGGLVGIPAEEFFGAAVWQLYKSIESPYKSFLKLLLIEAYAADYPSGEPLSTGYKKRLAAEDAEMNDLDPYVLMYTVAEEYLMALNDSARLEVLRRSFYLKTNLQLSDSRTRDSDDWRAEVIERMVEQWGWSKADIVHLDSRNDWGLMQAVEERRNLIPALTECYKSISKFGREQHAESAISDRDLNILGRKLYSAFERKPSKIEVLTRGICPRPEQTSLSLHEVQVTKDELVWHLFAGTVSPSAAIRHTPIKRSSSIAELLLWAMQNRLTNQETTWHVFCQESALTDSQLRNLLLVLNNRFDRTGDENEALAQPRQIRSATLLANVGIDPHKSASIGGGILTSDRNDPFVYGGRGINLVHSVDLLFTSTWGETFCYRFEGARATLEALAELIQWVTQGQPLKVAPSIKAYCDAGGGGTSISQRIESLASKALAFFIQHHGEKTSHFVLQSEDSLHHLKVFEGQTQLATYRGQAELVRGLASASDSQPQRVMFDGNCAKAGTLPLLYRANEDNVIQVVSHQRGDFADIFILDERGNLTVHRHECRDTNDLLIHYHRFLRAALPRCNYRDVNYEDIRIDLFDLEYRGETGQFRPVADTPATTEKFLAVQVYADSDSDGHQQFTIYVGQREFSTWEHGGSLFVQVAEYIFAQRKGPEHYPVYITDLDLSIRFRHFSDVKYLRPIDLLNYKRRIELKLTHALRNRDDAPAPLISAAS